MILRGERIIKIVFLAVASTLVFVSGAQAGEVSTQPVRDDEVSIQPIDYPVDDRPVSIQPIDEEVRPPVDDRPVSIQPIDEEVRPPVGHRIVELYLWVSRDGKRYQKKLIPCRLSCPEARRLLRVSAAPVNPFCQDRYFGSLRAGGSFQGRSIGVFSQINSCQMAKWRKVSAIYNHYF